MLKMIAWNKKSAERLVQTIITVILFALVFYMMFLVESIQGTARVANYAGLVRGATQRMVKLEISGNNADAIIAILDGYIDGIKNGSEKLQLVRIEDEDFQDKMMLLSAEWRHLKAEVQYARVMGYKNTNLVVLSERYFRMCDDMVGTAEMYTQKRAQTIKMVEVAINIMILLLLAIIIRQYINSAGIMRRNKELNAQVFVDKHTQLPNKNRCEQLIKDAELIAKPTGMFMFDLNNLKFINDSLGHEEGDKLIANFSKLIRESIDAQYFVGRYGGDEFIAIIPQTSIDELTKIAANVREAAAKYNDANAYLPISYVVGYALSTELEQPLMKNLLAEADKRMYINKQETKKLTAALEEDHSHHLNQMMNALEHGYSACYYCDYQNQTYRVMKNDGSLHLPAEGSYNDFLTAFINHVGGEDSPLADLREMFSLEYVNKHISSECSSYDIKFLDAANTYWLAHVMLVDIDRLGRLSHFILTFTDITHTRNMEYAATHDALTDLLNRYAGFMYVEQALAQKDADSYALMIIDIDNFKAINDTFGHSMGDAVIKELANAMRNFFSREAILIRYGGDEFLILAKFAQDEQALHSFMQRLVASMSEDVSKRYPEVLVTISVGVALVQHGLALQTLFNHADDALYHAKRKGKNTYNIYQAEEKS